MKSFLDLCSSDFLKDHLQIYMILIVFERSVLLVYERECNAIFLLDTHTHMKKKNIKTGGLIAMCSVNDLDFLIKWMCKNIFPETTYKLNHDQSFEVSVIAFKGQLQEDDHPLFVPRMIKTPHMQQFNTLMLFNTTIEGDMLLQIISYLMVWWLENICGSPGFTFSILKKVPESYILEEEKSKALGEVKIHLPLDQT
ncbi:unnamed protein product [Onchocerca flexuosa]|uniref:FBA_2 domain-containing protein n=1 Tax=Onchocerca flexuosa TaxID=387005 RepID=A0A183I0F4_9BILA|nr:unnamed protein product [Onchocerca flexuosa]